MMSADETPALESTAWLDVLHARYDGFLPRRSRLLALSNGYNILHSESDQTRREGLSAQCAGARLAVARRRRQLPAAQTADDTWLCRLTSTLRDARDKAAAARSAD